MNDDDDEYVPIERMRAQFESNAQTTEEKTQPITVKSIFKTLTCLSLGHDIANSLFDRKKNIDEQQISPIDEEFVIDTEHYRCLICFDYFAAHHVVQCKTNVGHMVCLACFRTNAEQHEKLCDIVCPERTCATCYDDVTLDICLTEQLYQKLLQNQIKFDREIAMSSNVERALYCKCGFVAVVEKSETGDGCVRCVCGEVYCLKCGNYIHEGSLCPPPANTLRALDQKWINEHAKKCPNCAKPIEKNGGCNHMTCAQCKHEFCWICLGKWPGCKCK